MIRAGQLRTGLARDELENNEKFEDFVDFLWVSWGRWWGKVRSTCNTKNPWIKINKNFIIPRNHKKQLGAIFGGEFSKLGRNQQN